MNDYRIIWSHDDKEYVGLCENYPSLSWLDPDPVEALKGIISVVKDAEIEFEKEKLFYNRVNYPHH